MFDLVKDAVSYAKSKKELNRIIRKILLRYKILGRFSGSIELSNITEEESRIIGSIDYKLFGKSQGKLNIKKFIQYFTQGKFEDLDFEAFMREYFKGELTTNRQVKEEQELTKKSYFEILIEHAVELSLEVQWLSSAIKEKNYGYTTIMREYETNRDGLTQKLFFVMGALSELTFNSDKLEPLPLFSSRLTRDPHFFDIGTTVFRLMMFGLCYKFKCPYPENVEETNEILFNAGIARDELSIFTTIYGIRAFAVCEEHLGWLGFYNNKEPLHVSIKNLNCANSFEFISGKVYIFENPTVFMEVIRGLDNKIASLVCTSGQLNTASLMLLDKLFKEGATFYYSGDFDPEGLRIADKLKSRYKDKLILWRYSSADYLKIKGNKGFEGRENKLIKLKSDELIQVKEVMKREKVCGYQELLVKEYVDDIMTGGKGC